MHGLVVVLFPYMAVSISIHGMMGLVSYMAVCLYACMALCLFPYTTLCLFLCFAARLLPCMPVLAEGVAAHLAALLHTRPSALRLLLLSPHIVSPIPIDGPHASSVLSPRCSPLPPHHDRLACGMDTRDGQICFYTPHLHWHTETSAAHVLGEHDKASSENMLPGGRGVIWGTEQ